MGDSYLAYARSKFRTRLPADRQFTQSHFWMARDAQAGYRVGFTRFATRMLGEIVEFEFEVKPGDEIEVGQAIGWFEGFKAVTDLYTPLAGQFAGPNPELDAVVGEVHRSPYDRGWLYRVTGTPPEDAMDAEGYAAFLDQTIDRMSGRGS